MPYSYTWFGRTKRFLMRDLPNFFRNIYKFRKALWNHHWWDYSGTLDFIEIGINDIANGVEKKGVEVEHSRMKKVAKMRRATEIIKNIREDRYFDIVEAEMGRGLSGFNYDFIPLEDKPGFLEMVDKDSEEEQEFKRKYFSRIRELEEIEWNELWEILKGQHPSVYANEGNWDDIFDGTGMRGWWD
jgi:hypothetical protein